MESGKLLEEEMVVRESDTEIWILSPEEFKQLEGQYPHRKSLNHSMQSVSYCKLEIYNECILGTMKIPEGAAEKIEFHSFGFYLKENQLFFLEKENWLKNVIEKMKSVMYEAHTLQQFLIQLFEIIIVNDVLYLQHFEDALEHFEEELVENIPEDFHEKSMGYRKKLSVLHAYYEQIMDIGDMMLNHIRHKLTKEEYGAWQHYTNRAERLHNHVERLREHLVQIREMYQSQIDLQQNRVMSFLTVVTTVFLPLTLIAGWYGMNFTYMPELGLKYAYPVVIIISILVIAAEIAYFKKKKMF